MSNLLSALRGKFKPILGDSPRLDSEGLEVLSPKPMALPVGFQRPPTLAEQVARLVKSERFKQSLEEEDLETFEEADDFDISDDPIDPSTPYEEDFDHATVAAMDKGLVMAPNSPKRLHEVEEDIKAQKAAKKTKTPPEAPKAEEITTEE